MAESKLNLDETVKLISTKSGSMLASSVSGSYANRSYLKGKEIKEMKENINYNESRTTDSSYSKRHRSLRPRQIQTDITKVLDETANSTIGGSSC
jgi:hypothetical protein